jgi:serine phosphatase RsbU (regulator of sigma subunit)
VRGEFFEQWSQFGRSAAAATGQHFLNDRSDAEFDQLAVGLKSANPGLAYLEILSAAPSSKSAGELRIRAHSESPETVHEPYSSPKGVPAGEEGRWLISSNGRPVYHFCQSIRLDGRQVGMVVWGVPEQLLAGRIQAERTRIIRWSAAIFLAGALLILIGSNWLTRPIQKLLTALRTAGKHGIEVAGPTAGPDEIREVVAAFNEATESAAQLHKQMAERDSARREMEASQQLQRALLPGERPKVEGYGFGAACRMARQVGGDYYDIFPAGDDRLLIIVADVAGKGFPAALLMTSFRTATRLLAQQNQSPSTLLDALHQFLTTHHPMGPFVTACCASLDVRNNGAEIASAGHTPVLLFKAATGQVSQLNPKGRPIGIRNPAAPNAGIQSESVNIDLSPGDRLLMFTDGVSEARNRDGESYGLGRLETAVINHRSAAAPDLIELLVTEIDRFTASTSSGDDMTIFAIERIDPAAVVSTHDRSSGTQILGEAASHGAIAATL